VAGEALLRSAEAAEHADLIGFFGNHHVFVTPKLCKRAGFKFV
jgi:hypothetical protein